MGSMWHAICLTYNPTCPLNVNRSAFSSRESMEHTEGLPVWNWRSSHVSLSFYCELIVTFWEACVETTMDTKLRQVNLQDQKTLPPLNVAINLGCKSSLFNWSPVQFGEPTFIMTHSPNVLPLNTILSQPCSAGSGWFTNGGLDMGSVVSVTWCNLVTAYLHVCWWFLPLQCNCSVWW